MTMTLRIIAFVVAMCGAVACQSTHHRLVVRNTSDEYVEAQMRGRRWIIAPNDSAWLSSTEFAEELVLREIPTPAFSPGHGW